MLLHTLTRPATWIPYIVIAIIFTLFPVHVTNAETTDGYNAYDHAYTAFDEISLELGGKEDTATGSNVTMSNDEGAIAGAGVNAGTLIVIVLLACITVILLYSFVFKRKK